MKITENQYENIYQVQVNMSTDAQQLNPQEGSPSSALSSECKMDWLIGWLVYVTLF